MITSNALALYCIVGLRDKFVILQTPYAVSRIKQLLSEQPGMVILSVLCLIISFVKCLFTITQLT